MRKMLLMTPWRSAKAFSTKSLRRHEKPVQVHRRPKVGTDYESWLSNTTENKRLLEQIHKAAKKNNWEEALSKFKLAVEPSADLFAAIITAAARCRQSDKGLQIYSDMKKKHIPVNPAVLRAVMQTLGSEGETEAVQDLWQDLQGQDLDAKQVSDIGTVELDTLASVGDVAGVRSEMETVELLGGELGAAHASCLLKAYCEAADGEGAIQALDQIRSWDIPVSADMYALVLQACCNEIAESPDQTKVHCYMSRVSAAMTQDDVQQDEHLLEAQLALCLGVRHLADAPGEPGKCRPGGTVDTALRLIDDAKASGVRITPAVKHLYGDLCKLGHKGSLAQVLVTGSKDRGPQGQ
eukprot:TRINITY_DN8715_c0_g2_i1.p1 TRINITY_DN8715_c0_g2~~TRINITY_DN8715_c0_g2_i1.p1  ORF type:complete len:352 (+),score=75.16 TRINITY_DN8715_c0_g2_i1:144-1199(+)